jgi:DNA-binding NtrC family response regulator
MPAARPPHILVVDAESEVFELLAPGFTERRYRLTHVRDVAAAKEILDDAVVDVVLVDTRLLNAVGTMLVGQAAFGVPLLPLPANQAALEAALRSRRRRPSEAPSADPAAVDRLVRWIGEALRRPDLKPLP